MAQLRPDHRPDAATLDLGPASDERTGVTAPTYGSDDADPERPAVTFAVSPPSRLWIAACLGFGGAFLLLALFRAIGAFLASFEHSALEALLRP